MATFSTKESLSYGVHSEVGQLRKVMVCAPGMAHTRLTVVLQKTDVSY
jgi:arginine deiminase